MLEENQFCILSFWNGPKWKSSSYLVAWTHEYFPLSSSDRLSAGYISPGIDAQWENFKV